MTGDENNLLAAAACLELLLQTKPVQPRHAHIENQAGRPFEEFPRQIIFRGSKSFRGVPGGFEQAPQTAANGLIVVHHSN